MRRFVAPRAATETTSKTRGVNRKTGAVLRNAAANDDCESLTDAHRTRMAFRVFRPSLPASVEMREGRLARVSFNGVRGEVMAASGPWRTSGEWWREDGWEHDEWDIDVRFGLALCVAFCFSLFFAAGLDETSSWSTYAFGFVFVKRSRAVGAARPLLHLLRLGARELVRAGDVRLMSEAAYTELHARSAFSFLEGAALPEELASACKEKEMGAMAVLDRDGVYGAPRFYLAAKKIPIQAHIGAEVTSAEGWRYPLLVASREGYQNLCRLITRMKLRARKGEGNVAAEEVAEKARGLICLTGGDEGPLAHALAQGGIARGTECVEKLVRTVWPRERLRGIAAAFLPR